MTEHPLRLVVSVLGWCAAIAVLAWAGVAVLSLQTGPLFLAVALTPWGVLVSVLVTGMLLVLRLFLAATLAAVAAIGLALVWIPAFTSDTTDAAGTGLSVSALNMQFGRAEPSAVLAWVDEMNADVLALEEVTPQAWRALHANGISYRLPHGVNLSAPNASGTALLSRHPIIASQQITGTTFNNLLATLQIGSTPTTIAVIHPAAPGPAQHERFDADWQILMPQLLALKGPALVVGDFNATPNNRELRELGADGYESAATQTGAGLSFTWPTMGQPGFPIVRLDHILFREQFWRAHTFNATEIVGADHMGITANLQVR